MCILDTTGCVVIVLRIYRCVRYTILHQENGIWVTSSGNHKQRHENGIEM